MVGKLSFGQRTFCFQLSDLIFGLLLLLVPLRAGADPDVDGVAADDVSRTGLEREDDLDRLPVDPADVGPKAHELEREGGVLGAALRSLQRDLKD